MQYTLFDNTARKLENERIYTVTELSKEIESTIRSNFGIVSVSGEISGLKRDHIKGHMYFTLKDENAVLRAICWRGTKLSIELEDGMKVVIQGEMRTYAQNSQYNITVLEAKIVGDGELLRILKERYHKFQILGYFHHSANPRPFPKYPQILGIVTSTTGAVLHDMEHRLRDRYPACNVLIWPANVQGDGAARQISSGIIGFNEMAVKPDIIIIARGGGSVEDLWQFNEEILIKTIFDSKIPIVSAVGHETDTTLSDYAADLRAPTPTAAIELITPVLKDVLRQLNNSFSRLINASQRILRETTLRIANTDRIQQSYKLFYANINQKIDYVNQKLNNTIDTILNKNFTKISTIKMINLKQYFQNKQQNYFIYTASLGKMYFNYINICDIKLENLSKRLEQGSYLKILEKGFCYACDKNGVIRRKSDIVENDMLLHFYDGNINIQITK